MFFWSLYYAAFIFPVMAGTATLTAVDHNECNRIRRRLTAADPSSSAITISSTNSNQSYNFADGVFHPVVQCNKSNLAIFALAVSDGNPDRGRSALFSNVQPTAVPSKAPIIPRPSRSRGSTKPVQKKNALSGEQDNNESSQTKLIAIGSAVVLPAMFIVGVMSFRGNKGPGVSVGGESMAPRIDLGDDNDDEEPDEDPGIFSEDEEAFNSKFEIGNDASLWSPPAAGSSSAWQY